MKLKVEMTETEARQKMGFIWGPSTIGDSLWQAVKKTFELEFKTELLPIAKKLENVSGFATSDEFHAWSQSPQGAAPFDVEETYMAGIARYNAYPKLWVAAQNLLEAVRTGGIRQLGWCSPADKLEDLLAKGPKP